MSSPRWRWRWWTLWVALALLGIAVVRTVKHRMFLSEWIHARIDIEVIERALDEYAGAHSGTYPPALLSLVTQDEAGNCWLEGYNGRVPKDPWRTEYVYEPPTTTHAKARVLSYGADGRLGGSGDDADIESGALQEVR